VVLASAGIGITPMAGMLSHLVKAGSQRRVMLLHADESPDAFPLRRQVTEDIGRLPEGSLHSWFVNPAEDPAGSGSTFQGFMDVSAVELPLDAEYYLCGPLPFLQAVRSDLIAKGVPAKDIQYEVFGPDLWLADFQ
jgi:nitric oxide dioxygenase